MKWKIAILAALFAGTAHANEGQVAWLSVSKEPGFVKIEIFSDLAAGIGGTYSFEARKIGPSGKSVNRQAGSIPKSNGSVTGPISVSRLSLEPTAELIISLRVEDDQGHIYEDVHSVHNN